MTTPVYSHGQIVWAQPPKLNEDSLPVTKMKGSRITKHPIIVLSVKAGTPNDTLTGVMVTSFNLGERAIASHGMYESLFSVSAYAITTYATSYMHNVC